MLAGGSANLEMLRELLSSRLQMPVEINNPIKHIAIAPELSKEINNFDRNAIRFGVAIGLALRGVEKKN